MSAAAPTRRTAAGGRAVFTGLRLTPAERERLEAFRVAGNYESLAHAARALLCQGLALPEPEPLKGGRPPRPQAQEALPV